MILDLIVNLVSDISDILGSEAAFEDMIFRVKGKKMEGSQIQSYPQLKNPNTAVRKILQTAILMKNQISNKLVGDTKKNNVFMALKSVKEIL